MSSSKKDQQNILIHLLGESNGLLLFDKIDSQIKIRKLKDVNLRNLVHDISNCIDNVFDSDYTILNKMLIYDIQLTWNEWILNYKKNYSNINYIEKNRIILDNRKNNQGFYWIEYDKCFSPEAIVRSNNCGRVPQTDRFIELRENELVDKNYINHTRVSVVLSKEGVISQIKGYEYDKPQKCYWGQIYHFIYNYEDVKSFSPSFNKPENNFKLSDLTNEQFMELKLLKPLMCKFI